MKMQWLFVFMMLAPHARASTFIGNGGNAGDVELAVTRKQLYETFLGIKEQSPLCECTAEFETHPICEHLRTLNEPQKKFCIDFLERNAEALSKLAHPNEGVRMTWTNDSIEVREGKRLRGADAVADRTSQTVTIHQSRFLDLPQHGRLFLLGHELTHFMSQNGKPITDEGPIGPFNGDEGSRRFVNAIAAATIVEAGTQDLDRKYRSTLRRSQAWKRWWLDLGWGTSSAMPAAAGTYAMERFSSVTWAARYFWNPIGVVVRWRGLDAQQKLLSSIDADERLSIFGAGLSYKIFPFRDPLTFFGQSHFTLDALAERFSARYKLNDSVVSLEEDAVGWGASVGCNYYLPLYWGLWLSAGASYDIRPYSYSKLKLKYDTNQLTTNFGVSYAF